MDDHSPTRDRGEDIPDEQALADREHALTDSERALTDSEQTLSNRDQQASDEDQVASDWDRDHGGTQAAHNRTSSQRAKTSEARDEISTRRDLSLRDRDLAAQKRDDLAALRANLAQTRDEDAALIDAQEELADMHASRLEDLRASARLTRARAASDRERAARDRESAALDRQQAALDREHAVQELEQAGIDELTGTRRRGIGLEELDNEIRRARREGETLVAAYVDVDGLKAVNDQQGHPAGDKLIEEVADKLRHHMRSYDLIVRLGGDEFLCAVPSVPLSEVRRRFEDLCSGAGSVSIGFSELREGESADELIGRADHDLLSVRSTARPAK